MNRRGFLRFLSTAPVAVPVVIAGSNDTRLFFHNWRGGPIPLSTGGLLDASRDCLKLLTERTEIRLERMVAKTNKAIAEQNRIIR